MKGMDNFGDRESELKATAIMRIRQPSRQIFTLTRSIFEQALPWPSPPPPPLPPWDCSLGCLPSPR